MESQLMYQEQTLRYGRLPGFQVLELPYAGDDMSMVVLLPDAVDGLAQLEASLTEELVDSAMSSMRQQQVKVYLPKFTFEDKFELGDTLIDLGMSDAFDRSAADLTGIADENETGEKLYIDRVIHQTFIDVSEEGTEAAAATAVIIEATSTCFCGPPPVPVFRADHPFLFALRDVHTGSLMFMGRVMETDSIAARTGVPEPSTLVLMSVGCLALIPRRLRAR